MFSDFLEGLKMRRLIICCLAALSMAGLALAQANNQGQDEISKDAPTEEQDLAKLLRDMLEAQNQAKQNEDLEGTLKDVHERVGNRQRRTFIKIFKAYDLTYSLDSFKLLYHDSEIAIARVKQTLRRIDGPMFKDNRRDILQIYRRSPLKWQLADLVVLDRVDFDTAALESELPKTRPPMSPGASRPSGAAAPQPTEPPATQPAKKPDKED